MSSTHIGGPSYSRTSSVVYNVHEASERSLCRLVDENIEEIKMAEEENKMDIEDFDSKSYIIKLPTDQDRDNTINDIDISCVKQETNIAESDDVNNEIVEKVSSPQNVSGSGASIDDTLNISSILSNTNNDLIHKKSEEQSSKTVKNVDLKRILDTSQVYGKPINQIEVCILCACSDSSDNKSITNFAKLILDLSGIDILNIDSPPVACNSCFKQLKMVDIFKQQIIYTNNLIMNSLTVKGTSGTDGGKESRKSDASEEMDEKAKDWFTFETTQKTVSKARRSKKAAVKSNLCDKNIQVSIDEEERPYLFAECGCQYTTLDHLKSHSNSKRIREEPKHLCYICGNIFNSGKLLQNHLEIHSGEKPFACLDCNEKFSFKWNLNRHKRLHTNNFPYKCKLCPAFYRHDVSLKNHIVKSHTASECAVSSENNCASVEKSNSITNVQSITNEGVINEEIQTRVNEEI